MSLKLGIKRFINSRLLRRMIKRLSLHFVHPSLSACERTFSKGEKVWEGIPRDFRRNVEPTCASRSLDERNLYFPSFQIKLFRLIWPAVIPLPQPFRALVLCMNCWIRFQRQIPSEMAISKQRIMLFRMSAVSWIFAWLCTTIGLDRTVMKPLQKQPHRMAFALRCKCFPMDTLLHHVSIL